MIGIHPVAAQFSPISDKRRVALKADIVECGQRIPIVLVDGLIWDGRARAAICEEIGIVPWVVPLRGMSPLDLYIGANMHRAGAPASDERRGVLALLSEIHDPIQVAAAAQRRAAWLRLARAEFQAWERGARMPCEVCNSHADFVHAHHRFPLALQFECGLAEPIQDHDWLCPVHHKKVHVLLSGYLLGTRELEFLDSVPPDDVDEWRAIIAIADRGIDLCSAAIGPRSHGKKGRCDPPFGMYVAKYQSHIYPWRGPA